MCSEDSNTHLQWREVMVDQKGETSHWNHKKLNSESVVVSIISCPELCVDQVDGGIGTSDVDNLFSQHRNKETD